MLFEVVKKLVDSRKTSLNKVEEDLGFSKNYLYNLKRNKPNPDVLVRLADYFNVSTDYLLGRTTETKNKVDADFSLKLEEMMAELANQKEALMFRGEALDDETKAAVLLSMQQAMRFAEMSMKNKEDKGE